VLVAADLLKVRRQRRRKFLRIGHRVVFLQGGAAADGLGHPLGDIRKDIRAAHVIDGAVDHPRTQRSVERTGGRGLMTSDPVRE
jgi:hypothetical protein